MGIAQLSAGARHLHTALPDEVSGYAFDPEHSWWATVVAEASTNLIINPSFEYWNPITLNVTEFSEGGSFTLLDWVQFPAIGCSWGRRCVKMVTGAASGFVDYNVGVDVTPGPYTFSLDLAALDTPLLISMAVLNTAGMTTYARRTFTISRGGWHRLHLTYQEALSGPRIMRLSAAAANPSGLEFYTDAWQFERKPYPTTYLDGDMIGFQDGRPNESYYWHGAPHQSTSSRRETTGSGGRLVGWSDESNFVTTSIVGLGSPPIEQKMQTLGNGAQVHRGMVVQAREFTVTGRIFGRDYQHLRARHNDLMRLLRPNNTVGNDQMVLRYQQVTAAGSPVGPSLELACFYRDGLQGSITNLYQEALALQFRALQPFFAETKESGQNVTLHKELWNNTLVYRDEYGEFFNLGDGDTDGGIVTRVGFLRDGRMIAVGDFTELAGDIVTGAAVWDGDNWQQIDDSSLLITDIDDGYLLGYPLTVGTGDGKIEVYDDVADAWDLIGDFDGVVNALQRDTNGDIWVAGQFETNQAATTTYNNVGRWNATTEAWETLGSGLTDPADLTPGAVEAHTVLVTNDGYVYFGGSFEQGDSGATETSANAVIRWNMATELWEAMGSGMNGPVEHLIQGQDGYIYAVGEFDQDGFESFDLRGFARWNGYTWEEVIPLTRVDGTFGADGFIQDQDGVFWFYNRGSSEDDIFVVEGLGNVSFFGWRNGIIYPPYMREVSIRHMATGPGNRTIFTVRETVDDLDNQIKVPALNRIQYEGTGDAALVLHVQGIGRLNQIVNLSTAGGLYTRGDLILSENEHLTVRSDGQRSLIYSNQRVNLYARLLAGPTALSALRLIPGENRISVYVTDTNMTSSEGWLIWRNRFWGLEGLS